MPGYLVERGGVAGLAQVLADDVLDGGELGRAFADHRCHQAQILDAVELGIAGTGRYRLSHSLLTGGESLLRDAVERRVDAQQIPGDAHQHRIGERAG